MTLSTFTVKEIRSEEIRVDAINLSCPYALLKSHTPYDFTSSDYLHQLN
jgi:hypothetical protein